MRATNFQRLPRRLSTEPTSNDRFPLHSGPVIVVGAIQLGNPVVTRNPLQNRPPRTTPRRLATRGKGSRDLRDVCGPRRNQDKPGAAATVAAAMFNREKSRSRTTASEKERVRSTFVPTVGRRSVMPLAGMRRKRARAKGNAAAGRAVVRRMPMAGRWPSVMSIRDGVIIRCAHGDGRGLASSFSPSPITYANRASHRNRDVRHIERRKEQSLAAAEATTQDQRKTIERRRRDRD